MDSTQKCSFFRALDLERAKLLMVIQNKGINPSIVSQSLCFALSVTGIIFSWLLKISENMGHKCWGLLRAVRRHFRDRQPRTKARVNILSQPAL